MKVDREMTNHRLWWARAYGLAQQNRPVEALQMMGRAEPLTLNNPKFYNDQGMMMEQGGQWENAVDAYTKSLVAVPFLLFGQALSLLAPVFHRRTRSS